MNDSNELQSGAGHKRQWALLLAMAALAQVIATVAFGKLDAVPLEYVPLDASVSCNRLFFKSSMHFPNTVFVMPRAVLGMTSTGKNAFEIDPVGPGRYVLSLGVYFPRDEELLKAGDVTNENNLRVCDFEKVKFSLNKANTKGDPAQQVTRISHMPLTSFEVRLPGVRAIGRPYQKSESSGEDVDVLDYHGESQTVEIPLNEDEKNDLLRRMQKAGGLQGYIKYRFQSRSRTGSVRAKIDMRELSAQLRAGIAGSKKLIAKAQLEALVGTTLKNTNVAIQVEEGSAEFEKNAKEIIDKVLKAVDLSAVTAEKADASGKKDGSDGLIDVDLFIQLLEKKGETVVEFTQMSAPELATSEAAVGIRAILQDPHTQEIHVRAGFLDVTLEQQIQAGQTIRVTPAYHFLTKLRFKTIKTYLTLEKIKELDLIRFFPDIGNYKMDIENKDINGEWMAVGTWKVLGGLAWSPARYRWFREETIYERVKDLPGKRFDQTPEALKDVPVFLTFSRLGRQPFRLSEMSTDNEFFTAKFDETGSIVITAKRDLGLMTFRESYKKDSDDFKFEQKVTDVAYQERQGTIGGEAPSLSKEPGVLKRDDYAITQYRTVVFFVSKPESKEPRAVRDSQ